MVRKSSITTGQAQNATYVFKIAFHDTVAPTTERADWVRAVLGTAITDGSEVFAGRLAAEAKACCVGVAYFGVPGTNIGCR